MLRTRRYTMVMPAPRPFRPLPCLVRHRAELIEVLNIAEAALANRQPNDGAQAIETLYSTVHEIEAWQTPADDLYDAAGWGAAFHRLERGESAQVRPLLPVRGGLDEPTMWNAVAWAGIEVAATLDPARAVFGTYFVEAGYYLAHYGGRAVAELRRELASWCEERQHQRFAARAHLDGRMVAEFWLDSDGELQLRSAMPIRPVRGIERLYEDLVVSTAFDDLSHVLGQGRPHKTPSLPHLFNFEWDPPLDSERLYSLLSGGEVAADEPARLREIIDLREKPTVTAAQPAGWYPDPLGRFDYRWWDGARWTHSVSRAGVAIQDNL